LTCLLFVAVSAKGDSSSPYEYEQSYNSAWHAPAAVSPKSSYLNSVFSGGLRERQAGGLVGPLMVSALGTGVSLAATAATASSLTDDINKVSERTDKAAAVAAKATTNLGTTCAKVNEILDVTSLGDTTDDAIATFAYTESITHATTAVANTLVLLSGGTMTANSGVVPAAATPGALLEDLDRLRVAVAAAISVLDKKIDSILDKTKLTC
jgi:hypothetical protein